MKFEPCEGVEVDGVPLTESLHPATGDELAECVQELNRLARPVVVRGGGSRIGTGNVPQGPSTLLSTRGLGALREFDEEDGVVLVESGARVGEVADKVRAAGWELALDPPGGDSTIGGALASAATGPCVTGFGPVRDFVLGLEVVLGSGERTRCGGRVVKNVTGYDLAKLYVGSFGSLGVIESAWLRLRPVPEARQVRVRVHREVGAGLEAALDSSRRLSARAVALLSPAAASSLGVPAADGAVEVCEFAGDAPTVARDAETVGEGAPRELVDELRRLQGSSPLRGRFSVLPSAVPDLWSCLVEDPALTLFAYPGAGLLYAIAQPEANAEGLIEASRRFATGLVLEELPLDQKHTQDVFVDAPAPELQRALKQQFDPKGILNPGRLAGRI